MTVAYLPSPGAPEQLQADPRIRRAERARASILKRLRRLLGMKTGGSDARMLDRGDAVAELMARYHELGLKILQSELL
jgi:hypothetical protein